MASLTLACVPSKPEFVARTVAELYEEASRIEILIRSVHQGLADPNTSLGEGVRLANWSKHLEAYLEGMKETSSIDWWTVFVVLAWAAITLPFVVLAMR